MFDPFEAGAVAAARGGFRRMCMDSIAPAFGGVPARTCTCLATRIAAEVPVEWQWEAESADSLVRVLGVTVLGASDTVQIDAYGLRLTTGPTTGPLAGGGLLVVGIQLGSVAHAAGLYPGNVLSGLGGSPRDAAARVASGPMREAFAVRATHPDDPAPHRTTLEKGVPTGLDWVTDVTPPVRIMGVRRPLPGVAYDFEPRDELERRRAEVIQAIDAAPCSITPDRRRELVAPLRPLAAMTYQQWDEYQWNMLEGSLATRATASCEAGTGTGLTPLEASLVGVMEDQLDPCTVLRGTADAATITTIQRTWSAAQFEAYIASRLRRFRNGRGLTNEERDGRRLKPGTGQPYTAADGAARMQCLSTLLLDGLSGRR